MIENIILNGILAVGAGALVLPASRKLLLGDVEYDWLAGELDLDSIDADGQTVRTKSGPLFRVFKVRGSVYDAKVLNEQNAMRKIRGALLHAIGELRCDVCHYGIKRQHDISFDAQWPNEVLEEVGKAEQREFRSSYYTDWYIVLSSKSIHALVEASSKINAMGSDYRITPVLRQDDTLKPCPLTCFINYLVSGDYRKDLPAVSESLSGSLPASDLHFEKETGRIITHTPNLMMQQIIAVRAWPETVDGRIIADVLALRGDIEVSQICVPSDRDKALVLYRRKVREQNASFFGNDKLAGECETFVQLLTEGNTTVFSTQLQIIVRGETDQDLNDRVADVCKILGARRVKYSVETKGAPTCWFNRIPGERHSKLLRPLNIRETNIASLWPFNYSPAGMMSSPYGDRPVRFFHTPSGQAYAYQFHVSDRPQSLGNFLVFAPSGGGKSTFMMHLLGGLAKFENVPSYIFDSKEGARFMVEAMGGHYQGYDELQLNPLDVGEDTPQNRHRIYTVLKAMSASAAAGDDDDKVFAHAIELAFKLEAPERTLNAIYEYAFQKQTPLRKAFARWVTDSKGQRGLNAHVFNAPHDSLNNFLSSSHMVGINMNEALEDPVVGPPVVAHISAAISKSAAQTSRGFCIFIDEAAKLLQNDGFKSLAQEMYREYRKLNGAVGLAFQDPAALFRSGVAESFLDNTATMIFLPNRQASRESLDAFNFNDEQLSFILNGPQRDEEDVRQALIVKRDAASGLDETAIIDIHLGMLGDGLRFYRAGVDANKDLSKLKAKWGEQWRQHL